LAPPELAGRTARHPVLTVCCLKWFDPKNRYNDKFVYSSDHVNRLHRMVARHLSMPHEFVCITDDTEGLAPEIRPVAIDRDLLAAGARFPKLMIYRPDAAEFLGERILLLDLDTVIVGHLDPLLDTQSDFKAWKDSGYPRKANVGKYNTSMVLLAAGSHPEIWEAYQREAATIRVTPSGHSDQAFVSRTLGDAYPVWTVSDGVYSFRADLARHRFPSFRLDVLKPTKLPRNARVVFFHGNVDPSEPEMRAAHPWIAENWA
jgi:hypothetical protein